MTTSVQSKKLARIDLKEHLKLFQSKTVENGKELLVTVGAIVGLLTVLGYTQPLAVLEYSDLIVLGFMLYQVLRIVQDLDDHVTVHELSERLRVSEELIEEIHRMVKNDTSLSEDEFNERLRAS